MPNLVPVDHDPFASSAVVPDVLKSSGAGLVRGAAGLAGLPDLVASGGALALDKATQWVASKLGVDGTRPAASPNGFHLPTTEGVTKTIEDNVTGPLYRPQTTAGRYAQTVSEFVPGAILAPGGMVSNAIKFAAIPGVASEAAGQLTKGSAYEPVARGVAAVAAGGGAAMLTRPGTATQAIREALPEGVTPQMVDQATSLIDRAARQQGITLSWPEALSQVAGRPVLSNTMRHLEAAPQTEARMAQFYAPRAGEVEAAGRRTFDTIASPNPAPSTIGPTAGQAAEGAINTVRDTINAASDPFYRRASTVLLQPQEMAQFQALPGYKEAAKAVRGDPQLNRYISGLPENSVGFLNEVKKYLDQASTNAAAPLARNPNMQRAAGYGADAKAARQIGVNASQDYDIALAVQEQARKQYLEPLLQGPLGKIASKDTTTKAAIDALFPTNPLPHSADEVGNTIAALSKRSPTAASDLVRAHVESVFNEATQALQSGANQAGGAKFAAVLAGNPQQKANLQAAVEALPGGQGRWAGFEKFLETLQATGTRQNIGSKTAYNTELLNDAKKSGVIGESMKMAANPLKGVQFLNDKFERWKLGRNLNQLADILTNPGAASLLRSIADMPVGSMKAQIAAYRLITMSRAASLEAPPVNQSRH